MLEKNIRKTKRSFHVGKDLNYWPVCGILTGSPSSSLASGLDYLLIEKTRKNKDNYVILNNNSTNSGH